eukprot:248069-Chlamydomonas_euryale.AAC.1
MEDSGKSGRGWCCWHLLAAAAFKYADSFAARCRRTWRAHGVERVRAWCPHAAWANARAWRGAAQVGWERARDGGRRGSESWLRARSGCTRCTFKSSRGKHAAAADGRTDEARS